MNWRKNKIIQGIIMIHIIIFVGVFFMRYSTYGESPDPKVLGQMQKLEQKVLDLKDKKFVNISLNKISGEELFLNGLGGHIFVTRFYKGNIVVIHPKAYSLLKSENNIRVIDPNFNNPSNGKKLYVLLYKGKLMSLPSSKISGTFKATINLFKTILDALILNI